MTIDNGENYEIRPEFANPFLQMMDPEGETARMLHELMEIRTSKGMDALISDMPTEEVGQEFLNSARWAATLRYPTRAAEFIELFESLEMDEKMHPELYSEYRYIRVKMLCQQISGNRLSRITVIEPIINEERELLGRQYRLANMLRELASFGHVPALREWMDINFGDLSKNTPDEDRYDPHISQYDDVLGREFHSLFHEMQMSAIGYGEDEPDPFILKELLDVIEEFCQRDPSHDLSLRLLESMRVKFLNDEYKDLHFQQRAEQMYRSGLSEYLRLRIPSISCGLLANKKEKNALGMLIDIGWQNPECRYEVDDLISELRESSKFTDEDEVKIASWKADFTRKVKYKGKQKFSWNDHSNSPPRY